MCKLCSFVFSPGVAEWLFCKSTGKFTENEGSDLVILQYRQVLVCGIFLRVVRLCQEKLRKREFAVS